MEDRRLEKEWDSLFNYNYLIFLEEYHGINLSD